MTPEGWRSSDDPRALLCFAASCIPREHLALVLAELAEATVYYWYVRYPLDWRLAWAVATLRAWCFGHATNDELERARDQVLDARVLPLSDGHADQAARAAATCVVACTTASLCRTMTAVVEPRDLDSMGLPDLLAGAAHFAALAAQHGFDGDASAYEATHRRLADLTRRLIAFPARPNEEWLATPGLAFSGDAMLRLDGRKIGDVVPRDDFARLSAERAVAFDAAQQLADPESPLPSAHRDPPPPQARLSGCVMTPIVIDGRQVGTRISCYGHPEAERAAAPAPVIIKREDSRRTIDRQGTAPQQETRARLLSVRPPIDGAKRAELDRAERKQRAVVVPETHSAPGSRWVTAVIFALLSLAVFARVAWGGSSGDDTASFVVVALAVAAAVWVALECIARAEKEVFTAALNTLVVAGFVGWLAVHAMGSGVRFVLDKAHLDTPGSIRRREDSLQRDRRELATRRTEEVRARLGRKQQKLAALRPVPVSVEAMLAVLVVSPLLLGFAFAISWRVSHTVAWHAVASRTPSQVPLWVGGFPKRPRVT